jgi:hypothetical protein
MPSCFILGCELFRRLAACGPGARGAIAHELEKRFHLDAAADDQWGSLVNRLRKKIQNRLLPIDGHATGLFRDHRQGIRFIEQPQLAVRVARGWRIEKYAPLQQRPMEVCHQRTNVTRPV